MTAESKFYTHQVATIVSLGLSVFGVLKWFLFHHSGKEYQTPFTGLFVITLIFWSILYLLQLLFILQWFVKNETTTEVQQRATSSAVGYHFIVFNVMHFFWCYAFKKHHFVVSGILLIINFLNIMSLYLVHKTYAIKNFSNWVSIHLPVASFPLSWLMYAIFWNGAAMVHSHNKSFVPRILANIFIWDFLLVPMCFLVLYNDYGVGFSTALLTLGIALGQLFTKAIALQWIFGFVIAGAVFLASCLSASGELVTKSKGTLQREEAPLLTEA